jgi:ABC-type transport system involved in cytochrome bd biosynthesis fused ATPase/permease subunit
MARVLARPTGLVAIRGGNGSGKSTLLAALKARLRGRAYYWPTHDRLAFAFNSAQSSLADAADDDGLAPDAESNAGHSSGERQVAALREIVARTDHPVYLFDEWDANLDAANRQAAITLVEELALRARVIEISHRDQP